jgi:predicted GIY-YIG superfamily endonuclease
VNAVCGTLLLVAYRENEKGEIVDALEELCSPLDYFGFASGGIYCFWDFSSREVLYIGKAKDLGARFKQHNELSGSGGVGNKRDEITAYFERAEILGFSALVRDASMQTITSKNQNLYRTSEAKAAFLEQSAGPNEAIDDAEGIAIDAIFRSNGSIPPWNKIGGSVPRWFDGDPGGDDSAEIFTGAIDSLFHARKNLRELADDPTSTILETCLDIGRLEQAKRGARSGDGLSDVGILTALDERAAMMSSMGLGWASFGDDVQRIRDSRYVLEYPFMVEPDVKLADLRSYWCSGAFST